MTETQKRIVLKTLNAWRKIGEKERCRILRQNDKELAKNDNAESIFDPIPGKFPVRN